MSKENPQILVLSSVDPHRGPAVVAEDQYKRLKKAGYDVDFMTLYPVEDHPEYLFVYKTKKVKKWTFTNILRKITDNNRFVQKHRYRDPQACFFYRKETNVQVSTRDIVNSIKKKYDVVVVYFWQEMLTFKSIEAIYDKLRCLFIFRCVDYSPMAGGCHFTGDCKNFETGCGNCPGIGSNKLNDFTRFNVKYRKRVYEKVKPVVSGNGYMQTFYDRSYLLKDYDRRVRTYFTLDLNHFCEQDRNDSRKLFEIPITGKFIILFGAQSLSDERKGVSYLLNALKILYDKLNEEDRNRILLVLAGRSIDEIKDKLCFDYKHLGFVKADLLPRMYSAVDVFLSPSVNDAGPSMVNQSLACGTPVVSFEMGTAIDYVKDRNTGYCAKLRDSEDFANGIEEIFRMSDSDYQIMRKECRIVSENLSSSDRELKMYKEIFEKYL